MNSTTHIDFSVKGKSLQLKHITELLGIAETSGFNPNEPYEGKAKSGDSVVSVKRFRPSFGVWHFSTEGKVGGNTVEDHARYFMGILGSAKERIQELLQSPSYEVRLSIWYVGPSGFEITSDTMLQLAALCEHLDVRCFETEQASTA